MKEEKRRDGIPLMFTAHGHHRCAGAHVESHHKRKHVV